MPDKKGDIRSMWRNLQYFWGKWRGSVEGSEIEVIREYHLVMDENYIYVNNMGVSPSGVIDFKHLAIANMDIQNNRIIFRVYSSTGRIFNYILESMDRNGKKIVWETANIENFPGWKAKVVDEILGKDEFEETLYMKKEGEEYKIHRKTHFRRGRKKS